MTTDIKRPYDEAHFGGGLLTYGTEANSNAAICMDTNAEAYYNAEAYECRSLRLIPGQLQLSSDIIEHEIPCEMVTTIVLANANSNSMSSTLERIELVAQPPQHIVPCASQSENVSATKPTPLPRASKSKNIAKNMSSSGCQNKDIDDYVPVPGQSNDTTSALKGFNHLSHSKGEKSVGPACIPSTQATTRFSKGIFILFHFPLSYI